MPRFRVKSAFTPQSNLEYGPLRTNTHLLWNAFANALQNTFKH